MVAIAAIPRSRLVTPSVPQFIDGRDVQQRPDLELAVGDGVADVRDRGPGRDRPVDLADVVLAGDVDPGVVGLRARAGQQAQVVTVQVTLEPADDGQLQPAQRRLGRQLVQRDGGPGRRARPPRRPHPCRPARRTAPAAGGRREAHRRAGRRREAGPRNDRRRPLVETGTMGGRSRHGGRLAARRMKSGRRRRLLGRAAAGGCASRAAARSTPGWAAAPWRRSGRSPGPGRCCRRRRRSRAPSGGPSRPGPRPGRRWAARSPGRGSGPGRGTRTTRPRVARGLQPIWITEVRSGRPNSAGVRVASTSRTMYSATRLCTKTSWACRCSVQDQLRVEHRAARSAGRRSSGGGSRTPRCRPGTGTSTLSRNRSRWASGSG